MSWKDDRIRQRELLRGMPAEAYAVEAWLRDFGGPSGLVRCIPGLIAIDTGIHGRSGPRRVAAYLERIAAIRPDGPDGPPLALYDSTVEVWYWTGYAKDNPPYTWKTAESRWNWAQEMPDSPPRAACLDDLRPHYERLIGTKPKAAENEPGPGDQQKLPLPGPKVDAPAAGVQVVRQPTQISWRFIVDEWAEVWRGTTVRTPGPDGLKAIGSVLSAAVAHDASPHHWRAVFRAARRVAKAAHGGQLELRFDGRRVPVTLETVLRNSEVYAWLLERVAIDRSDDAAAEGAEVTSSGLETVRDVTARLGARLAAPGTGPPGRVPGRV